MNDKLKSFAHQELMKGLAPLSDRQIEVFKLMYGRNRGRRSVEAAKAMSIEDVIAEIPDDQLDWAMQQVDRSQPVEATRGN